MSEQSPFSKLITRRRSLQVAGLNVLGLSLASSRFQARAAGVESFQPLNRFPRMVQEYFVGRLRHAERLNIESKRALRTRSDAEAYVQAVRQRIRECFGPMPERTPLNPQVTGMVERDEYRIEKILFESRPQFFVTGNLYVPKGRSTPLPGVIGVCGHSASGKTVEAYQSFCQGLVRMGYVVFIIDPIGQGERLQYPDEKFNSRVGVGVREHLHAGNQQFLIGEFIGAWRAWDGIRALDYLLTRPEVDPRHVGVTGNSGGGTMTTWLCGLESRWTMAAPSCFVTTFRRNLENELPADTEQCPPRAIALGLNHEDFLVAMAPKPVIILGKEKDYFDARGTEEAFARLKYLYWLLGAEENISLFQGPTHHGYSQENREAMYRWFNRITGISDDQTEPELVLEPDKTIECTPNGQVAELNSRPVFSFTRERAAELAASRPVLDPAALVEAVVKLLRLPPREGIPDYRILRSLPARDYATRFATTYMVNTEPGVSALVYRLSNDAHYSRPPRSAAAAVLYVPHRSSDAELREPEVKETLLTELDSDFFACDPRCVGESQPDTCGQNSFLQPYGSDYFYAIHSLMLDYPMVGQKTHDILSVLDWLRGFGHQEIHLVAKGWGAIPATFAALLAPAVTRVTLRNALTSYTDIAQSEDYNWPLSSFVPRILEQFDLPDCYRVLQAKELTLIDPWNAQGLPA